MGKEISKNNLIKCKKISRIVKANRVVINLAKVYKVKNL